MVGTHKKMRVGRCNRFNRTHPLGYGYGSHRRKFLVCCCKLQIKIENTKDSCIKFDILRKKELLLHALRGAGLSINPPPNVGYKATLNPQLF